MVFGNEDLCAPYTGQQWVRTRLDWPLGDSLLTCLPWFPLQAGVEETEVSPRAGEKAVSAPNLAHQVVGVE